jgi:hypothetical protein
MNIYWILHTLVPVSPAKPLPRSAFAAIMATTASAVAPRAAAAETGSVTEMAAHGQPAASVNARPLNAARFLVAEVMRVPQAFA